METWKNWAIFLVIAGALAYYYTQQNRGPTRGRSTSRTSTTSSAKNPVDWIESESQSKPVKQVQAKAKAARKSAKTAVEEVGKRAGATASATSSSAGADADDDLSPGPSPTFNPLAANNTPSGKNVSDMLGPGSASPSVLSIKTSEQPARPGKAPVAKAETPSESKKARQNRKKAEEAKVAREEDEKQRQALLEKQRRTAREARGEPAKNGLGAAKAPTSNPWTTVSARGAVQAPASAQPAQLLDTFDAVSTASSSEAPTNGTAPTPDSLSNSAHFNNALSEEEQVKIALADTTAWETVPKGKNKKKKIGGAESVEGDVDERISPVARPVKPVQVDKPARPTIAENKKPSSRYQILSEEFVAGADNADDWPVV